MVHEVLGVVAAQGRPRAQGRGPETVGIEPVGIEAVGIERGRDAGELAEAAPLHVTALWSTVATVALIAVLLRVFVGALSDMLKTTHELHMDINEALKENGIEIPFPQRDLHVRSAPALAGMQDGVRQYEVAVPPGSPQTAPATSPSSS